MMANAGIGILCKAIEMSLADWRRQTAVNLDGVFLSVKYAVPAMRRAGGGSIWALGDAAGGAVAVQHIVGYAGRARHRAPILLEPALLEWLPGAAVFDHRSDPLIRWHAL